MNLTTEHKEFLTSAFNRQKKRKELNTNDLIIGRTIDSFINKYGENMNLFDVKQVRNYIKANLL